MKNLDHLPQKMVTHLFVFLCSLLMITGSFESKAQSITLLSPNGGEDWLTGTTQSVHWSLQGDAVDIMIEYSIDGGSNYSYLGYVSAYDSTESFSFINYLTSSPTAKIKVSVYSNSSIFDESDSTFTIIESPVYFYDPWGGESYYRTSPVLISWYSYSITVCNIDYSTDNGSSWQNITTNYEGFTYDWTAPDMISDSCLIRISDTSDATIYGLSPMFSIIDLPVLNLISPNGGETWNFGQSGNVSWTGSNLPYYMYLDYSLDGGQSWNYLGYAYGADTGGSVDVYVPQAISDEARVRITDPNFDQVNDISDNNFTIYTPPVIMYYPAMDDEFFNKSTTYISWLATGIDSVKIELSTDNGQSWIIIEDNAYAYYGYYAWTISANPSNQCIIKVSDVNDASKFGLSGVFSILPTPVIEITSPVAGDILNTDSAYTITWTHDNEDSWYIDLEYSLDAGFTWNYLGWVYNTVPEGSFTWTTPDVESEHCLIRVYDYNFGFVADTSELFSIRNFPSTPICMVSVDSEFNQNLITWDKPVSPLIDTFIVYRESTTASVYEPIGHVGYGDSAFFIDINSNPSVKPYRYKLGFKDASENIYPIGAYHQTIHLSINKGVGNSWNLAWTDYIGFDINTYNIYRKTDTSEFVLIGSISASFNSYTDFDAPQTDVYYVVEAENPNGCGGLLKTGGVYVTRSNMVKNSSLGITDRELDLFQAIYPNPASKFVTIEPLRGLYGKAVLMLTDISGQIVYREEYSAIQSQDRITLDVSGLENGIYLLSMRSSASSSSAKVVVSH